MGAFLFGAIFGSLFSFVLYALIYVGSEDRAKRKWKKDRDGKN